MRQTCDGALDLCAILEFNGHCLMTQFHEKSAIRESEMKTTQKVM